MKVAAQLGISSQGLGQLESIAEKYGLELVGGRSTSADGEGQDDEDSGGGNSEVAITPLRVRF